MLTAILLNATYFKLVLACQNYTLYIIDDIQQDAPKPYTYSLKGCNTNIDVIFYRTDHTEMVLKMLNPESAVEIKTPLS